MVTLDDVYDALLARLDETGRPIATAPEVAEQLPQSRRKTLDDLRLLERSGDVASHSVGANATVWWPTNSGRETDSANVDGRDRDDRAETTAVDSTPPRPPKTEPTSKPPQEFVDALEDADLPKRRDRAECVAAIYAAHEYVRENDGATMKELVLDVMPEHPVGYDAEQDTARINDPDQRNRSTWWRNVIRPGFEALPTISKPPRGGSEWSFVDGEGGNDGRIYDPTEEF